MNGRSIGKRDAFVIFGVGVGRSAMPHASGHLVSEYLRAGERWSTGQIGCEWRIAGEHSTRVPSGRLDLREQNWQFGDICRPGHAQPVTSHDLIYPLKVIV